eukprot:270035_1
MSGPGRSKSASDGYLPLELAGLPKKYLQDYLSYLRTKRGIDLSAPPSPGFKVVKKDAGPPVEMNSSHTRSRSPIVSSSNISQDSEKLWTAEEANSSIIRSRSPSVPSSNVRPNSEKPWTAEEGFFLANLRDRRPCDSWSSVVREFNAHYTPLPDRSSESLARKFCELDRAFGSLDGDICRSEKLTGKEEMSEDKSLLDGPHVNSDNLQSSSSSFKKIHWTSEEDAVLRRLRESHPSESWVSLTNKFISELPKRTRSHRGLRDRWQKISPVDAPKQHHANWTDDETSTLLRIRESSPNDVWSNSTAKFHQACPGSNHRTCSSLRGRFCSLRRESDALPKKPVGIELKNMHNAFSRKSNTEETVPLTNHRKSSTDSIQSSSGSDRDTTHFWTPEETFVLMKLRESNPGDSWSNLLSKFHKKCPTSIHRSSSSIIHRFYSVLSGAGGKCKRKKWSEAEFESLTRLRNAAPSESWSETAIKFKQEFPKTERTVDSIRVAFNSKHRKLANTDKMKDVSEKYSTSTSSKPKESSSTNSIVSGGTASIVWTSEETDILIRIRESNSNETWTDTAAKFHRECPGSSHRSASSVANRFYCVRPNAKNSSRRKWSDNDLGTLSRLRGASPSDTWAEIATKFNLECTGIYRNANALKQVYNSTRHELSKKTELDALSLENDQAAIPDVISPAGIPIGSGGGQEELDKIRDRKSPNVENEEKCESIGSQVSDEKEESGRAKSNKRWTSEEVEYLVNLKSASPSASWVQLFTKFQERFAIPSLTLKQCTDCYYRSNLARKSLQHANQADQGEVVGGTQNIVSSSKSVEFRRWSHEESEYLFQLRSDHPSESWAEIRVRFCRTFPRFKTLSHVPISKKFRRLRPEDFCIPEQLVLPKS